MLLPERLLGVGVTKVKSEEERIVSRAAHLDVFTAAG